MFASESIQCEQSVVSNSYSKFLRRCHIETDQEEVE